MEDVLAIEKELNRFQSEVESMQGRLDRMKSQAELSELSVALKRKVRWGRSATPVMGSGGVSKGGVTIGGGSVGESRRRWLWHGMFLFLLGLPMGLAAQSFKNRRTGSPRIWRAS